MPAASDLRPAIEQALAAFTAEPLAAYFKLPTDALYDERIATAIAQQRLNPPDPRAPLSASNADEAQPLRALRRVPVSGQVKGGADGYLEETSDGEGFIEFPTTDSSAYALRVRGDSMHPRFGLVSS